MGWVQTTILRLRFLLPGPYRLSYMLCWYKGNFTLCIAYAALVPKSRNIKIPP